LRTGGGEIWAYKYREEYSWNHDEGEAQAWLDSFQPDGSVPCWQEITDPERVRLSEENGLHGDLYKNPSGVSVMAVLLWATGIVYLWLSFGRPVWYKKKMKAMKNARESEDAARGTANGQPGAVAPPHGRWLSSKLAFTQSNLNCRKELTYNIEFSHDGQIFGSGGDNDHGFIITHGVYNVNTRQVMWSEEGVYYKAEIVAEYDASDPTLLQCRCVAVKLSLDWEPHILSQTEGRLSKLGKLWVNEFTISLQSPQSATEVEKEGGGRQRRTMMKTEGAGLRNLNSEWDPESDPMLYDAPPPTPPWFDSVAKRQKDAMQKAREEMSRNVAACVASSNPGAVAPSNGKWTSVKERGSIFGDIETSYNIEFAKDGQIFGNGATSGSFLDRSDIKITHGVYNVNTMQVMWNEEGMKEYGHCNAEMAAEYDASNPNQLVGRYIAKVYHHYRSSDKKYRSSTFLTKEFTIDLKSAQSAAEVQKTLEEALNNEAKDESQKQKKGKYHTQIDSNDSDSPPPSAK
jgi:hypothetical protein